VKEFEGEGLGIKEKSSLVLIGRISEACGGEGGGGNASLAG